MLEGIKETLSAIMNSKVVQDCYSEVCHQVGQGSHEMAAALLGNSDGFVMYPRQESAVEEVKPPEPPQQDMGMER